ncbi:hypothetical protein CHOTACABRAS_135 [Bacillus phage Chotacabras]|nr:hypothetical protein CHOTACABRAS_135 [Bacillus phage Chotacabras]
MMTRYEYKLVSASLSLFRKGEEALNEYGKEGWRFVTVEAGKAVFEREITKDEVFLTYIENDFGRDNVIAVHRKQSDSENFMREKENTCKDEGFPYGFRIERHDVK